MGFVDLKAINPFAYRDLQYDPERAFAPISTIGRFPFAIVVGPSTLNIPSFQELMAAARPNPETITWASWASPTRRTWPWNPSWRSKAFGCRTCHTRDRRLPCRQSWLGR